MPHWNAAPAWMARLVVSQLLPVIAKWSELFADKNEHHPRSGEPIGPSLRPSRDVHGLSRKLGGRGSDDKEAGQTGTLVAGTV